MPAPSPHRWVVAERRRPRTTQACMASCVREGRDRAHLSCAAIPSVTPGSYRRGRLLLWVFGVVDLPVVPAAFLVEFFFSTLFWTWVEVAVVSSFLASSPPREGAEVVSWRPRGSSCCSWSPRAPLGPLVGAVVLHPPCSSCCWSSSLWWIAPSSLSPSSHFYPYLVDFSQDLYSGHFFTAFPSCGVPARWRDLPNVVLDICGK